MAKIVPIEEWMTQNRRADADAPEGATKAVCRGCAGTGECLTCAGTGEWYAGTIDQEPCSSCDGSGRCPDCWGR